MAFEAGMDLAMGTLMFAGGVPGLIVGGIYYAIEYTIGWDTVIDSSVKASKAVDEVYNEAIYQMNQPSSWVIPYFSGMFE